MAQKFFITGTDTGVGKTYISVGLLKKFSASGFSTLGIKPISSGCLSENGILYNEDALKLQEFSTIKLPYAAINPYAFAPPIAPHIAASYVNLKLSVADLIEKTVSAISHPADVQIIEGAGGWHLPLNNQETMADFVCYLNIPVIMVVSIRLGCLNHAILTAQAIQNKGLTLSGWIANHVIPPLKETTAIIDSLHHLIAAPCLGMIPYQENAENHLDIVVSPDE